MHHRNRSLVQGSTWPTLALALSLGVARPAAAHYGHEHAASPTAAAKSEPTVVNVKLTEWKVILTPSTVPPGPVTFRVTNDGTIFHALEVEGHGLERSTPQIKPGADASLTLNLKAGDYEAYCPIGKGSHEMLGMKGVLKVQLARGSRVAMANEMGHDMAHMESREADASSAPKAIKVVGGGPVIQILPGPFPFADSARAIIQSRPPDQMADLEHKVHMGPYSNNVAAIGGDFSLVAVDRGAQGDSVSGEATFTTKDGNRWKLVLDKVQTKDIPFNPRFGGVIMGLFYHGASNVHTPLVPTIQSQVALWAFAHLYEGDRLVTDHAMVHVMLLSRTRRPSDWALDCWDCSDRPVEELQLQVTAPPDGQPFDAPGGFLFVNWEKAKGSPLALQSGERRAEAATPDRDGDSDSY